MGVSRNHDNLLEFRWTAESEPATLQLRCIELSCGDGGEISTFKIVVASSDQYLAALSK